MDALAQLTNAAWGGRAKACGPDPPRLGSSPVGRFTGRRWL